MSVEVQEEKKHTAEQAEQQPTREARPPLAQRFQAALGQINWRLTLLTAIATAIGWCVLFLSNNILQVLAGIVPVTAGLFLGRKVKQQLLLHGLLLGVISYLLGGLIVFGYGALGQAGVIGLPEATNAEGETITLTSTELVVFYLSFSTLAMIPFPAFGTVMSGRSEQRNREMREQVERRGGNLEKPHVVRTLEDLRGLSLPQFGTYINNLFKRKGFTFDDYQFIDKDKHLDLTMSYDGSTYLLRLSVADKVRVGTLQSLLQDMRQRDIPKGIVITSTEFAPDVEKQAKSRRNVVLIDGQTLFEIAEH